MAKQKLELTWIGKNDPEYDIANIEPRILEERRDLSYGDPDTENMIIHGDNLLALKALLPEYEGQVKCIYIDPPYNTGNAFEHYDDSVEHSTWLSLMKPRLELLRMLMREDGVIFLTVDDKEGHYVKVLCDEIFGRKNFIQTICWKSRDSISNDLLISPNHNFIFLYAKNQIKLFNDRKSFRLKKEYDGFENPDNDSNGPWKLSPVDGPGGAKKGNPFYEFLGISGYWRYSLETMQELYNKGEIIKRGKSLARKYYLSRALEGGGKTPTTWWDDCGTATEAKKEIMKIFPDNIFDTPKPERLLEKILMLGSSRNDIILDSFLGSGTTAAVAQKMDRKYIGIEMGEHAYTHVHKRMKKVVDGTDGLKLSEVLGWKGGGGFKFYELAPSFVTIDEFGNPVIDSYYNDTKLIRAMCKLMNYTFAPDPKNYWKQGKGQGNNSIYVTTQMLSVAMVQQIVRHLSPNETLLICPKKYEPGCEKVDTRITIKKIPQSILKACHYGKKEYLLPVKERAIEEIEQEDEE